MKRTLKFSLMLLLAIPAIFMAGCNKNNSSSNNTPNTNPGCGEGIMCGKLDTSNFVSDQYVAGNGTRAVLGTSNSFSTFVLTAVKASTKQSIAIALSQKPQVGHTYVTSNLGAEFTYVNLSGSGTQTWTTDPINSTHSGSVTITKFDTTANLISGTFSFTAASSQTTATHTFSNGAFTDVMVIR
jgi:hypothetical protein